MNCGSARAHARHHRDLRDNAGDARNLAHQFGVGGQKIQSAVQLGAGGIVERYHRVAGLRGHFQNADGLVDVVHTERAAVLANHVCGLTIGAAVSSAHGTFLKQRRINAVVKKMCKDLFLARLFCCHI